MLAVLATQPFKQKGFAEIFGLSMPSTWTEESLQRCVSVLLDCVAYAKAYVHDAYTDNEHSTWS